jgi:hypothetical protein
MNIIVKVLMPVIIVVMVISGIGKLAIRNYQNAIVHARSAAEHPSTASEPANSNNRFEGDLFAVLPKNGTAHSTPAEDKQRAVESASCIRVIFEKECHPKFADLVKEVLVKKFDSSLGYQLVFGESRGPLEEAATPVTLRVKVTTYAADFQINHQPDMQHFFRAVDMFVYKNQREVGTSWDMMTFAAEKELPQRFTLSVSQAESFNRERLGYLYQAFAKKLEEVPTFNFFPDKEFDAIRDLYVWPIRPQNHPPVDPSVFAEAAQRMLANRNRPLHREYLDAIGLHLLRSNAVAYADGVTAIAAEWLPHVDGERLELLRSHLNFGDYSMMKGLLQHRQGYLLYRKIPEVWTDPGLAEFSRSFWRNMQPSNPSYWMQREFADKLNSPAPSTTAAGAPAKTPRILIVTAPQAQASPPAPTPTTTPATTVPPGQGTQIPPRVPLSQRQ